LPKKYKIVVLPGDGIGPEVISEAVKVLRITEESTNGLYFDLEEFPCGAAYWLKNKKKSEWPEEAFRACKEAHAILLGAVGLPNVSKLDGTPVGAEVIFGLRFGLDLYANVRPVKLFEGVPTLIQRKKTSDINFVFVRENTEGLYTSIGGFLKRLEENELAVDVRVITRKGAERVIKFSFELSRKRGGAPTDKKHRVTCVDKSNVLKGCMLFREIYNEVAANYPDVEKDYAYIDAFSQWILRKPEFYDVVVTTNMFGDILSEIGSILQGGLGMAPAANIGDNYAMFEPVHGSAPHLSGKKKANPIATILAAKMMLEWMAERHSDKALKKAAEKIEKAVAHVLVEGKVRTYDLGGKSSTSEMGDAIANRVKIL